MMQINPPHPIDETRAERYARGKARRHQLPLAVHGEWQPAADRPDPLALLREQDEGRLQHLLPIKYGRMMASPFAFLRGSAVVMAADLEKTAVSNFNVMLCGDAHIANFGLFASPERHLVFDVNDFDECYPGPWEWDLKRLAASIVVAGRGNGYGDGVNRASVERGVKAYRKAMRSLAEARTLDVWYFHVDEKKLQHLYDDHSSKKVRRITEKIIDKAKTRTQERAIEKLTVVENGRRYIKSDPPLLVPFRTESMEQFMQEGDVMLTKTAVEQAWIDYLQSLEIEQQFLLSRYRIVDTALRVGGVGSVGTRSIIVLLQGGAHDDTLILQLKEAGASALAAYLPSQVATQHAQRVVTGQRLIQATPDIFLGWHHSEISGNAYYWRQLKDMKGSMDVAEMDVDGFKTYVSICAISLARAHARTGDASAISGYGGKSRSLDKAIAHFAIAYADQTQRDYERLAAAVESGEIVVEMDV